MESKLGSKSVELEMPDDFAVGGSVKACQQRIRMGFIRKVYSIVLAQLILTAAISAAFVHVGLQSFVATNSWILLVSFIATIVVLVLLLFYRREVPHNYVLLAAFTGLQGFTIGFTVSMYDLMIVLQALVLTITVVISLTLFTMQSKYDFSKWGAALFAFLDVLIIGMILQLFWKNTAMEFGISIGGALLFCLFIIMILIR